MCIYIYIYIAYSIEKANIKLIKPNVKNTVNRTEETILASKVRRLRPARRPGGGVDRR